MSRPAEAQRQDPVLRDLRDQISAADRQLLEAMNRRLSLSAVNRGPLSAAGLRELFGLVLALTKREVARAERGAGT